MSSNYNLQAFTHGSVSADETHALVEYQGTWYDWDFAFVEGAGDGVLWERGTNDWKITKTSNGYKAEKTNGFSTADSFQPDSNGIVTISFSWNDHTGLKFKPPVISSGGGTSSEGFSYSGTLTVNGTTLEYAIPSTASSGTYMLMSSASATPQLNIVHGTGPSTGNAPNFDQTKIWTLLSPTEDELARINLTNKKVFCNFW